MLKKGCLRWPKGTYSDLLFICYFKNGPTPASFRLFPQTNNTIFKTIQCENVTSSLRRADLNPQPLEHESSPITNRPGLPPNNVFLNLFMYANLTYYFLHSSSVALPKARALKQSLSILNTWFIIVCGQRPKT